MTTFLSHTAFPGKALQHTATHCKALQHTAAHCSTLQHTVAHCNTLQHTATHWYILVTFPSHTASLCGRAPCSKHSQYTRIFVCTATHCNTLQHTATHCNTLQHTATHWKQSLHLLQLSRAALLAQNTVDTHWSFYALQHAAATHTAARCNMLQHTATHCNTLQRTAIHCITLTTFLAQNTALWFSAPRSKHSRYTRIFDPDAPFGCVAVCCSVLQCGAVWYSVVWYMWIFDADALFVSHFYSTAWAYSVLQCVAVCCSVLQCVAVCCSVVQCSAVSAYKCSWIHALIQIFAQEYVYVCVFMHVCICLYVCVFACAYWHTQCRTAVHIHTQCKSSI